MSETALVRLVVRGEESKHWGDPNGWDAATVVDNLRREGFVERTGQPEALVAVTELHANGYGAPLAEGKPEPAWWYVGEGGWDETVTALEKALTPEG